MIVIIRGGGDLASGVTLRLHRVGLQVVITELAQPLAVRRLACFAEAVYAGETVVEGVTARRINDPTDALRIIQVLAKGQIPVLIDPQGASIRHLHPGVVVDGRMLKQRVPLIPEQVGLIIGLGPGFTAGENCHAVVETKRGHMLGRVYWDGPAEADTGVPEGVEARRAERVLRAPVDGTLNAHAQICDQLEADQLIADVSGVEIRAPFKGALRGLLHDGLEVRAGLKIGDLDPRCEAKYCSLVSDKALAVAGGVLEAILSRRELRAGLWR